MISGFDPGALLARSYDLPRGPRVTLRLARVRDLEQVAQLLERQGVELDELELARLARPDPRTRLVICATALVGLRESVIGIGAIDLNAGWRSKPSLVVVDQGMTEGLAELISQALVGRVHALAANRAA